MGKKTKRPYYDGSKQKAQVPVKTNDAEVIEPDIEAVKEEILGGNMTLDAFVNIMARMGTGSGNLTEGAEYPLTRLSRNYQLMNSLYRSHWIARRIIDVIPQDMMKNWIQLTGELKPEAIKKFEKIVRRTKIRAKILEGLKWGRLYGGAAGIMMIEGQDSAEILETPLELDSVMPGTFKGIMILDRWSGIYPLLSLVADISDNEFGLPEFYQATLQGGKTIKVHHSRLIRFTGRDLPFWEKQAEVYWGASEIEHVFDEIKKRDNTSANIASLVFLANIRVMKMADLGQMLSTGNASSKERVYTAMSAQNQMMSNTGMYVMDKEDDFDTKQYTFSGLGEIYELFMMDVAGAAEIPVTKLFGRSPSGMNATGESDLQNYYDMIGEAQEKDLRPILDKLLPVLFMSEFGNVPDDFDYDFNPANSSNDEAKAELASKKTSAVVEAYNAGLISQYQALKELKQMEDVTGMWSNITDEDVNKADKEVKAPDMPTDLEYGEDELDEEETEVGTEE